MPFTAPSLSFFRPKLFSWIPIPNPPIPFFFSPSTPLHLPRASSSSLAGSSAEFPEQLAGDAPINQKKRRRSVAGVDQDELLDPSQLADPESCFFEFNGVQIHHKVSHHVEIEENEVKDRSFRIRNDRVARTTGLPMILLHGFGASVFSWDRVMRPLARAIGSKVLAFDRPAFGLTSRAGRMGDSTPSNPYSMAFSVLATISFIDLLGSGKAILMGHSAGCLVAVNAYFEAPERIAALILVAPAIVAPLFSKKGEKENGIGNENKMEDGESNPGGQKNPFARIWNGLLKLYTLIAGVVLQMLKGMKDMVSLVSVKVLAAVLRSALAVMLVRMIMDKFGILAIRNAWYDASQVTDHVLHGYTKPLRTKGWEMALLEFTIAMLTDSASQPAPPLTRRLADIKCPVLIVTGDTDRLVPSWNAERLSRAIPGSTFEVIKDCGHLPHEERVQEFLVVVERFLERVFGAAEEQLSQAAVS